jgi:aminomethyltransferase
VATERQVEVTGRDALAFAELLTPRDLSKLPVGHCRYVVVTSEEGGIVNDPVLLRLAEDRFWFSASDSDLLLWTKGVAVNAGLEVAIGEPDVSPLQVQGPKSPAVIEALFGAQIAGLGYYRLAETELDGIPLVVTRTGWSAEVGYELFLRDGARAEALWDRVLEAGRPQGIAVTGPSDIRRVEAGILGYGCDIGLDTNPFEAGLERLVELDKPAAFIGKAALERIAKAGATRRLVGIEITGAPLTAPFAQPWPVLGEDGAQVGKVTVALHSPRLGRNIGYAMVPAAQSALGTKLTIAAPSGEAEAIVAEKPFVKASR